jgi:hypothetical protein
MTDAQNNTPENDAPENSTPEKSKGAKPKAALMTEAAMDKVTKTTADILKDQPKRKIRIFLPKEERDKLEAAKNAGRKVEWPYEFVQINGHGFQIQKGIDVEVPDSVAEVLEQAGLI